MLYTHSQTHMAESALSVLHKILFFVQIFALNSLPTTRALEPTEETARE